MPPVDKLMPMCASYGISLWLCEIRIYLFGLFTFAKIADNNIGFNDDHHPLELRYSQLVPILHFPMGRDQLPLCSFL